MQRKVFNIYVGMVLNSFNIEREDLFTKTKRKEIAEARHMLYWMCFADGDFKVGVIVRMMRENGYDVGHSSVIYGINVMNSTDDKYHLKIQENICLV